MSNHSTQTRKALATFRIPALVCFTALAVFAADPCKTIKLEVPDPATLNLKDGEHVIAAAETPNGRLEAHVSVKGKAVSAPRYSIGGRALREASESQIPSEFRDCLKSAQKAQNVAAPSENRLAIAARPALSFGLVAPTASAKTAVCVVIATCGKALDGKYYCVAYACCSVGATTSCSWHSGLY